MEENIVPNNKIDTEASNENISSFEEKQNSKITSNDLESKKVDNIEDKDKTAIKPEFNITNENTPLNKNEINPKKEITNENTPLNKNEIKPKKDIPIEKKPFEEFVKIHLIPSLREEIKQRGFEIEEINLENTSRPIAGDKCWVIYCNIKDTCNFWLSFEKNDISSSKSISLSKPYQEPSIIESFLIDEKRITLKLITSRILQRLNGQKLIGVN